MFQWLWFFSFFVFQLYRTPKTASINAPYLLKSNLPILTDLAIFDKDAQPKSE